jgi:radical SAM-linked protein
MFVHHTNTEDANADARRLVCYDCGVACDMTQMRNERIEFLERLGADRRLPLLDANEAAEREAEPEPPAAVVPRALRGTRYRFRFEKAGPMALLGHLDLVRELPRIFRRLGIAMVHTGGFHPKPDMTFAPALSLGVMSVDEYADLALAESVPDVQLDELVARMTAAAPAGLVFRRAVRLGPSDVPLTKLITGARYVLAFARSAFAGEVDPEARLAERCQAAMSANSLPIRRELKGIAKVVDARSYLLRAEVGGAEASAALGRAGLVGDLVALDVDVEIRASGGVKAAELAAVLAGDEGSIPPHRALRLELFGSNPTSGRRFSPIDLAAARAALAPLPALSALV